MSTAPEALIVIDVQEAFDDVGFWGPTTNPAAERRIAELIEHWRATGRGPIVIVRHDSVHPDSPLHPGGPGNALKPFLRAERADALVTKRVNSAFHGDPDLGAWLDERGIERIVLCGIQTNMCVETTARVGGNLGYAVTVPLDATRTFDLAAVLPDGTTATIPAAELMRGTAVNLQGGGFAAVTSTAALLGG